MSRTSRTAIQLGLAALIGLALAIGTLLQSRMGSPASAARVALPDGPAVPAWRIFLPAAAVAYPKFFIDLGDAPDSTNNYGIHMIAYPAGGPIGVIANFPTVYSAGSPPYGPPS
ncbi:MAG: hypothetical protein NT169_13705 [Chloroflexi bacterium]|nr:hypothetical protein [Chloroflexota bacterium]